MPLTVLLCSKKDEAVLSLASSLPPNQGQHFSNPLDPDALPFVSEQPESSQQKAKPDIKKPKVNAAMGSSKDAIDMEYAKAEIKTLKAKLKEQELSVKDLKF